MLCYGVVWCGVCFLSPPSLKSVSVHVCLHVSIVSMGLSVLSPAIAIQLSIDVYGTAKACPCRTVYGGEGNSDAVRTNRRKSVTCTGCVFNSGAGGIDNTGTSTAPPPPPPDSAVSAGCSESVFLSTLVDGFALGSEGSLRTSRVPVGHLAAIGMQLIGMQLACNWHAIGMQLIGI